MRRKPLLAFLVTLSCLQVTIAQTPWIQPIVESVSGDSIFATMSEMQPMDRVNSHNSMVPADYLKQRLLDYQLDTVFFQHFKPNTPPNVVGIRYGTMEPDTFWLMGAHYDAVVPGAGADDNASGTAAVIEMARVIRGYELEKSLILVLFSAEEVGLWGSTAFVDSAINHIHVSGMINLDMIAYSHNFTDSSVSVGVRPLCAGMLQIFNQACSLYVPEIKIETDSTSGILYASDHAPFWSAGIPGLFLIENLDRWGGTFNPWYHQPADTIGRGANSKWLAEKITSAAIATLMFLTEPYSTISVPQTKPSPLSISVYPNPATNTLSVKGLPDQTKDLKVIIYDLSGRMVLVQNGMNNGSTLDISSLPEGIYHARFQHDKGTKTAKFTIIR
jgi:hypothetical protein